MYNKKTDLWLSTRGIILDSGFTERIRALAVQYIRSNGGLLCDVYANLGCSKQDIFNWKRNPCSTHASTRTLKHAVIVSASHLFLLSEQDKEKLANSAGLSLYGKKEKLIHIINHYNGKRCELLGQALVSERMLQYYLHGLEPTKQALLAIAVSLGLPLGEMEELLLDYGYCLSSSVTAQ